MCSVEKSKVGNNFIMSLSISIGENNFGGVDSLEIHDLAFSSLFSCMVFSVVNLIYNKKFINKIKTKYSIIKVPVHRIVVKYSKVTCCCFILE